MKRHQSVIGQHRAGGAREGRGTPCDPRFGSADGMDHGFGCGALRATHLPPRLTQIHANGAAEVASEHTSRSGGRRHGMMSSAPRRRFHNSYIIQSVSRSNGCREWTGRIKKSLDCLVHQIDRTIKPLDYNSFAQPTQPIFLSSEERLIMLVRGTVRTIPNILHFNPPVLLSPHPSTSRSKLRILG